MRSDGVGGWGLPSVSSCSVPSCRTGASGTTGMACIEVKSRLSSGDLRGIPLGVELAVPVLREGVGRDVLRQPSPLAALLALHPLHLEEGRSRVRPPVDWVVGSKHRTARKTPSTGGGRASGVGSKKRLGSILPLQALTSMTLVPVPATPAPAAPAPAWPPGRLGEVAAPTPQTSAEAELPPEKVQSDGTDRPVSILSASPGLTGIRVGRQGWG